MLGRLLGVIGVRLFAVMLMLLVVVAVVGVHGVCCLLCCSSLVRRLVVIVLVVLVVNVGVDVRRLVLFQWQDETLHIARLELLLFTIECSIGDGLLLLDRCGRTAAAGLAANSIE